MADMDEQNEKDCSRRETLFQFIRRAFQDGAEERAESAEQGPEEPQVHPTGEDPKSKARLEDGACHADGE
jgi:hypothetical protein